MLSSLEFQAHGFELGAITPGVVEVLTDGDLGSIAASVDRKSQLGAAGPAPVELVLELGEVARTCLHHALLGRTDQALLHAHLWV